MTLYVLMSKTMKGNFRGDHECSNHACSTWLQTQRDAVGQSCLACHSAHTLTWLPHQLEWPHVKGKDQNKCNPRFMQVKLTSRKWMVLVWWKWIYGKVGQNFLCFLVHFTPAPDWLAYVSFLGQYFCFLSFLWYLILLIIHLLHAWYALTVIMFIFHPVLHPRFCCCHAQEVTLLLFSFCGFCLCYRVCHTPLSFLSHAALCAQSLEEFSVN